MKRTKAKPPTCDLPTGLNIVLLRRIGELGMTRVEVADKLWIGRVNFYYRVTGRVYWTFPELVSLCEILDMKVSELVRLAEQEVRRNGKVHSP